MKRTNKEKRQTVVRRYTNRHQIFSIAAPKALSIQLVGDFTRWPQEEVTKKRLVAASQCEITNLNANCLAERFRGEKSSEGFALWRISRWSGRHLSALFKWRPVLFQPAASRVALQNEKPKLNVP